jgi:hypothetical protein
MRKAKIAAAMLRQAQDETMENAIFAWPTGTTFIVDVACCQAGPPISEIYIAACVTGSHAAGSEKGQNHG